MGHPRRLHDPTIDAFVALSVATTAVLVTTPWLVDESLLVGGTYGVLRRLARIAPPVSGWCRTYSASTSRVTQTLS
ncbi:hypothetical protein CP557_10710 [Natrinema ejinorense]|uniref:Uncharacterized protein n=1 Tax=Natrinema ejinorense TaxID=373386 RepID=A0A2A5QVT0_9EURY|nr:hypothetical protein CP557_10710 [Natrinema ejinorense]